MSHVRQHSQGADRPGSEAWAGSRPALWLTTRPFAIAMRRRRLSATSSRQRLGGWAPDRPIQVLVIRPHDSSFRKTALKSLRTRRVDTPADLPKRTDSDVEAELHHVAVLHHVVLALDAHLAA